MVLLDERVVHCSSHDCDLKPAILDAAVWSFVLLARQAVYCLRLSNLIPRAVVISGSGHSGTSQLVGSVSCCDSSLSFIARSTRRLASLSNNRERSASNDLDCEANRW